MTNALTTTTPAVTTAADRKAAREHKRELDRLAQVARNEADYAKKLAENPLRLLKLLARSHAGSYCETSVEMKNNEHDTREGSGFVVNFTFTKEDRDGYGTYHDSAHLTVYSDFWNFDDLERKFDALDAERLEKARLRKVARDAYDAMNEETRLALGLTHRPY